MIPNTIYEGDCLGIMRSWPDNCVDAVVTDPPYGIRFMGKAWDGADIDAMIESKKRKGTKSTGAKAGNKTHEGRAFAAGSYDLAPEAMRNFQMWSSAWAAEALRVLKPGGHLLAFASTRTYHRMACGVEDAGFEIRDQVPWIFGQGFPKSLNVSKAIDNGLPITEPATEDAKKWQGWGTALKPANEPIVMARKPLSEATVAANVLRWGTGALNIDACRVEFAGEADEAESKQKNQHADFGTEPGGNKVYGDYSMVQRKNYDPVGRWPANLIVMHHPHCLETPSGFACVAGCPMRILDTQSGASVSTIGKPRASQEPGEGWGMTATGQEHDDAGGASRFFYCAKPDGAERNMGLDGMPKKKAGVKNASGRGYSETDPYKEIVRANFHPTVKPIDLMGYLVRLVTPPGGVVLDPFLGSGTTAIAAARLGHPYLGCEMNAEYIAIAEARIAAETQQGNLF